MDRSTERIRREIVRLCHAGLEPQTLLQEALSRLQQGLSADAFMGATADPATLLFTSTLRHEIPESSMPSFLENEFLREDVNKLAALAQGWPPVGSLYAATDGRPVQSPRYRDVLAPIGLGDELRAALLAGTSCWGFLCLFRENARTGFSAEEATLLQQLSRHLGEGVRASLLISAIDETVGTEGPGLLLLTDTLALTAATPVAKEWLAEMGDWSHTGDLPDVILALAARLQASEHARDIEPDVLPRARVRTRHGRWLSLHASRLAGANTAGLIAIILELARPVEVAPLLLEAYTLTAREKEVTQLVLRGSSTEAIADALCISAWTVQQHLKAVFEKVGVRSRRELVTQIFVQQYEPRIHDGESIGVDGWFAPQPPG
jgi:DNA-binding CsgD family transcriptional regulator